MTTKTKKTIRIRLRLMAYDHKLLDISCEEIADTVKKTGAVLAGPIPLPTKRELFTVLRGPTIDKKSREQFQIKTHKRLIEIMNPTAKTIDALRKLDLPAGVNVEIK
ncbi:MAG: 30S ribosomal protein S10 [Candidatus Omnitrophica bacterium]|nr:30S ribosomal protein S10 [Candidatus Omnitrophota bacterium]